MAKRSLRNWLLSAVLLLGADHVSGQKLPYTTHTEVGVLTYAAPFFEGIRFTGRTFHGVQLQRNWQLGLSAGVDKYTSFWVLPLSASARYMLYPDASTSFYVGTDIGYGFPWLNKKTRDEHFFSGGVLLQPTIGLRMGKKDRGAVTLSVSYQEQGFASRFRFPNHRVDDNYTFHRMALRFGMMF